MRLSDAIVDADLMLGYDPQEPAVFHPKGVLLGVLRCSLSSGGHSMDFINAILVSAS